LNLRYASLGAVFVFVATRRASYAETRYDLAANLDRRTTRKGGYVRSGRDWAASGGYFSNKARNWLVTFTWKMGPIVTMV